MSKEPDSPQIPKPKKHKKSKTNDVEKNEKKRKRSGSDDLESASHKNKKKHRTKHPIDATRELSLPSKLQEAPVISPCYQQRSSLYLPLPPIAQKHALEGLCAEHLSPLILTYYPPFHGVIVSYSNAHLSTEPFSNSRPAYARAIDEYAASFVWLTADFLLFKPQKGDVTEGWINLQNESNIGLLCLNFFNATIERRRLAKGWKWIAGGTKPSKSRKLKKPAEDSSADSEDDMEDTQETEENSLEDAQGYFQDAQGKKIEGLLRFRVKGVETSRGMDRETSFLNIEGTMLSDEEEKEIHDQETMRRQEKGKRQPKHALVGALVHGHDGSVDIDQPTDLTPSLKHRAKY